MYIKVIKNGLACHGGSFDYTPYLPKGKRPGRWLPAIEHVSACSSGYHACKPEHLRLWLIDGCSLYVIEYRDEPSYYDDKVVGRQFRFLRAVEHGDTFADVTIASLPDLIEAGDGFVIASGSATVRASGSATVRAYDSATVYAYDSATVYAYDSATVYAYGSATVDASGSATVRAYDSATVRASGSATVRAYDSATVRAYDSATVMKPRCFATCKPVSLSDEAILIDRSQGGIRVFSAIPVTTEVVPDASAD